MYIKTFIGDLLYFNKDIFYNKISENMCLLLFNYSFIQKISNIEKYLILYYLKVVNLNKKY